MRIDKNRVDAYLKKINAPECPLCGGKDWTISDMVFQLIEFDYRGILIQGAQYPVVPLTCPKCGNTYFINAVLTGLIDKDMPQNLESSGEEGEDRNGNKE